jgi:glycosyltransferase involved in cell wall biosynthesis
MRLVIDLQGAQGNSRGRGIGRFSQELALAMVRAPGKHEPVILLNDAIPESADILADSFSQLLPRENIRFWRGLTGCSYAYGSLDRRRASEGIRAQVLAGMGADLVHVASVVEGAADDVIGGWPVTHRRIPIVATFYDAIPLLWRDIYLRDPKLLAWYFRHLHELKQCTALLGISESSRLEAINHLGCNPADAFNVLAGFDSAMFNPTSLDSATSAALRRRYGLRDGFLLFVGAGDPRKNDVGLVQAYAKLSAAMQNAHQLVIVGSWNPPLLIEQARALNILEANLVLLPHVTDRDLPGLYSICRCFIMPSKHEGFGLPALEAMACGAAVIASNNTSLPEVVGLEAALFDADRPEDIADKLRRVLTSEAFHAELVAHGLARASEFTWAASAERAWAALEIVHDRLPSTDRRAHAVASRKRSLAFVGPLPPDESGIADYARDLLPALEPHYDITLVTTTGLVDDPTLHAVFSVLSEAAFAKIANRFDRILYQVGNSEFHIGIVTQLLPRHPGVVVLHDAFISNIPLNIFLRDNNSYELARALFESHGWPAVQMLDNAGVWQVASAFPCLSPIFRNALGVLQHSLHAQEVAAHYVGPGARGLMRLVPFSRDHWPPEGRVAARKALGLDDSAPVICSFGIAAATKRPIDVLDAWHVAFGADDTAMLAFVGHAAPDVRQAVRDRAAALGVASRVRQTGRVDQATYRRWLDAADMAIQLRTASRGETSAAIADCMAVGLPVVANAHGATAELPADTLVLLADDASVQELGSALAKTWADQARREGLRQAASEYVRNKLSPKAVAQAYRDGIEHFYGFGSPAQLRAATPRVAAADVADAARALSVSFKPPAPARLLLDASHMSQNDLGTGIQRVIREIGRRVLIDPKPGRIADMVRLDGTVLRHARAFGADLLRLPRYGLPEPPLLAGPGDTIVLMDNHGGINATEIAELSRQRRQGARIVVVIYDILPLQRPDWFPPDALPLLQRWLHESLKVADAALCISQTVAEELAAWLNTDTGSALRKRPLDIGWFHLGADFPATAHPQAPEDPMVTRALRAAAARPTLLMVGTIEPRKGHAQALAAFEQLWATGDDIGLTIVGKAGWSTETLQARISEHPEQGSRLHWLRFPGDASLAKLYAAHAGLLVASEGEGFGLPIVEAARIGLPVLARGIPVFREVAGDHVSWFNGTTPAVLADALRQWRVAATQGTLPSPHNIPILNWDESAQAFLKALDAGHWPISWHPRG